MQQIGVAVIVVALIGSAAAYVLAGALNFTKRGGVSVVRKARLHLSLLVAAFFLLLAASAYLQVPHLLTDVTGPGIVPGASYTDVMARIPAARVLMVVALLSRRPRGLSRVFFRDVACAAGDRPVSPHVRWRIDLRRGDSALRRHAKRAGGRDAVHDAQHRRDTAGVQSRHRADAQLLRRCGADARRHRPQRRHHQERAPLGSPAAARDLRPDPGAAHLLRLRVGRQRSLHDQRRAASGDALGARAEFRKPSEPHVDQRAPDLHARLRHHARAGERGDAGGAADSVRQGHPAAVVGAERHRRQRAEHLLRRADEQLRAGEHQREGVSLLEGRRGRERRDRLQRRRRRAHRRARPPAAFQPWLPVAADSVQQRHHRRQPGSVSPEHHRSRHHHRAVPALRRRPVSGGVGRRPAVLDSRRVHHHHAISLFRAVGRRHQLHPQLGEGDHRRLQRHDRVLRVGSARSARADARPRVSRDCCGRSTRCAPTCGSTCATRRRFSRFRRRCSRRTT